MKKIIAILLVAMLALGAVAETLPVLTMGTNAAFKPYEFYEDTEIVGIDAEIAAAICEKLGYQLEIIDMDFATLIPAVVSGKIDFAMAGMTVTEERMQSVNFSVTYATGVQSIIVPIDGPIKNVDDLYAEGASYTIGVQEGTTGDIYCTDDFGDENVLKFKTGPDAVAALAAGKIDAVVLDNNPAKAYIETYDNLILLDTDYAVEDYAIAIALDNAELKEKIDAALAELIADGTVDEIILKYIPVEEVEEPAAE
ncbi:MAG: transporter substrate-binding domain-containing protein [Clostridia bacterium]|nr:transporter substrate-binding domain-containing protein [Clostridia bacterium]MCR4577435.1 transporter substrate-binding domain-containing protein [Clostridiales bacterium]